MAKQVKDVLIPDIGGAHDVQVIEIHVKPGDSVANEASLITLEGDKATMDVPAPFAGVVKSIEVKVGDKVQEGSKILMMEVEGEGAAKAEEKPIKSTVEEPLKTEAPRKVETSESVSFEEEGFGTTVHAGPGVRRIAHEFGINLLKIASSGPKGRILKEDVQQYVKSQLKIAEGKSAGGGFGLTPAPKIDFSKFGDIEKQPLSKIKKATGVNLSRNWVTIPHVTQFGEADVTELEDFRKSQKEYAEQHSVKLTPLVFLIKAVVGALKEYPQFNASLDETGENLILKKYFHIGVAVDTPNGLVVPVVRDADKKGVFEIAKELGVISEKARTKGLTLIDMQGGCLSISSLGGIGGTAFTPIINAPEVAILGVSRMAWKSVCRSKGDCETRLMLPLSLSYDHRVIDGADGARFIVYLTERLSDIRTLLL